MGGGELGDGRSLGMGRVGLRWDELGWDGTRRGWRILKRGCARRVAARGGRRGDGKRLRLGWYGARCSATRLDSGRRTRACRGAWDGERDGALGETNRGSGKVAGGGEARANERMTGRGRGAAERKPAASACERRRFRPFHATGGREVPSIARFLPPLRKFPRVNGH